MEVMELGYPDRERTWEAVIYATYMELIIK
jgi:hypothetical protein